MKKKKDPKKVAEAVKKAILEEFVEVGVASLFNDKKGMLYSYICKDGVECSGVCNMWEVEEDLEGREPIPRAKRIAEERAFSKLVEYLFKDYQKIQILWNFK